MLVPGPSTAPVPMLRILHLEDNPADADLVRSLLLSDGIECEIVWVESHEQFRQALDQPPFDLILSDYTLPSFDGLAALALARVRCPDVPFILLSGTLGEEIAVESLKEGATDYVVKDRMQRLGASIQRAIRDSRNRMERKRIEEDWRQREELFRQITENVSDLIAVVDLQGRRLFNSASYEPLLGPREWLPGTDSFQEIHPEDRDRVRRIFETTVATGVGQRAEYRFLLEDGTTRFIESQSSTIRNAEGKVHSVIVVARDVTARCVAEEKLREQAALLEKASDAICVTDTSQRIQYWNKSAENLYGWTAREALGRDFNELLFSSQSSRPLEAIKSLMARREWQGELNQTAKAGGQIVVQSRWTLVTDARDQPLSILIISTDITEKKKLETRFLRAQRMESLGSLASGIAHDLNNALAPVLMASGMLRSKLPNPQDQRLFDALDSGAQRCASMITQILSFARGREGQHRVVRIQTLVSEISRFIRNSIGHSIRIHTDLPANLWPVSGDATQLHQVLMNLCVNARDAMPSGGTLNLGARNQRLEARDLVKHPGLKPGSFVILSVADTGIGIPADLLTTIFEPFFTTKDPGHGTGLGLATTLTIVRNHGGFITVQSEPGHGTAFEVALPAVEHADAVPAEDRPIVLPSGHNELILVVDDDSAVRGLAQAVLESHGYRILTACNGAEAVALYAAQPHSIDVVLTDISMPFLDGTSTIRILRQINPDANIIASSGQDEAAELARLEVGRPVLFLQKPYTPSQLLMLLRQALEATPAPEDPASRSLMS
jgi:PAS domain S-box-containing protein